MIHSDIFRVFVNLLMLKLILDESLLHNMIEDLYGRALINHVQLLETLFMFLINVQFWGFCIVTPKPFRKWEEGF